MNENKIQSLTRKEVVHVKPTSMTKTIFLFFKLLISLKNKKKLIEK